MKKGYGIRMGAHRILTWVEGERGSEILRTVTRKKYPEDMNQKYQFLWVWKAPKGRLQSQLGLGEDEYCSGGVRDQGR